MAAAASIDHGRALAAHERAATLRQLWDRSLQQHPDRIALIAHHQPALAFPWLLDDDPSASNDSAACVRWTYAQLDRGARALAARLARRMPDPSRPVAVLLNAQAEWALFFWAAAYLGVPFVPINPKTAAKPSEVRHILQLVQPGVLVAADAVVALDLQTNAGDDDDSSAPVKVSLAKNDKLQPAWLTLDDLFAGPDVAPLPPWSASAAAATTEALILFTSGTTSLPKPCCQDAVMAASGGFAYAEARRIQAAHTFIQTLPNFHAYGIGWTLAFWSAGGCTVLPAKEFEAQASLLCIDRYRATHISVVPTTARSMLSHPYKDDVDVSSLVSIDVSGADVVPSVIDACIAGFRAPAYTSYGMTESPGTLIWPEDGGSVLRHGAVLAGRTARGTSVKVCAPGSRDPVPRGEPGELHNGGVQVIRGYRDPSVSSAGFYTDAAGERWVVTGDQAVMDADGAVRISGRYKDLIIRGGENISPASIEDHLSKCNGVSMAQVVGVPDDMAGEVPIAVVSTELETRVDFAELKQSTLHALGPAFAPKTILHLKADLGLPAWPTTTSGKVRKVELRALVRELLLQREREAQQQQPASTAEALVRIWQGISGHDELQPSSPIQSFADSLMMMQLSSLVKRDLGRNISVEDYKLCTTIQDQADLVDARPVWTAKTVAVTQRRGPPTCADVPFLDEAAFAATQRVLETQLEARGLRWHDVQDVMPLPNWDAVFARRIRPTSWNLRFHYTAACDVDVLETAVRRSLEYHPTLRAVAVELPERREAVLATMRVNDDWMRAATTNGWQVDQPADLARLLLNDPEHDSAVAPGPMVKFHFARVRSDGSAGLVLVGSHAVMDMSMTKLWLDDLTTLLTGTGVLAHHEQFKDYANAFYQYQHGPEAESGVAYWAKKLCGIGNLPDSAYWPPQRAPEWFKGVDDGWTRSNAPGAPARPHERSVAAADKERAQRGIVRKAAVRDLARLKAESNVPVFMLVKAALALLNVANTGSDQAIFGTINAARTWPFAADYAPADRARLDGNPLDIAGCTTEYVLDRVRVHTQQPVLAYMQDVTEEEELNSSFVHAPFFQVVDRLRDPLSPKDRRAFPQRERDADAILPLIRRQSFNWLPMAPAASGPEGGLQLLDRITRMDNGLTVTGFLADDKKSVVLSLTWDAEHMTFAEAEKALDTLAALVETMGKAETWHMTVGDLLRKEASHAAPQFWGLFSGFSNMVKLNRRRRD